MVYPVDMVFTVDMVYTIDMFFTVAGWVKGQCVKGVVRGVPGG